MTSRTFTDTGSGNTYQDWVDKAKQEAENYGWAWIVEHPPGTYKVVAATDSIDGPYAYREVYYGLQPVPRLGLPSDERIAILEQQVAELQAQLEKRI